MSDGEICLVESTLMASVVIMVIFAVILQAAKSSESESFFIALALYESYLLFSVVPRRTRNTG